jgi:hypothetical protein
MLRYEDAAATAWNIFLLPGRYRIQAQYHSHGPYLDRYSQTDQRPVAGIWEGDLISNVAAVEVVAPQGEDLRALKQLGFGIINQNSLTSIAPFLYQHQRDFLTMFPTSTYAAYVVWEHTDAKGLAESQPVNVVKAVETGLIYRSELVFPCPDAAGKLSPNRCAGREATACHAYWYALILKNHPTIWFADEIKLRSSIDQLALKNYQAAQAEFEAISKDDTAPMAGKAKEYLALMKQKGWIKE